MRGGDLLDLALEALRLHRLRTGLTLTGIAIGVTAVILLTALGEAARKYVESEFAGIGTNLVIVLQGRVETTSGSSPAFGGGTRDLTLEDAEAIRRQAASVKQVAPMTIGSAPFEYGGRTRHVMIVGATAEMAEVRNLKVQAGEFLAPGDPRQGERVAVIGRTLQRELFQGENPLGKLVRIEDARFRVIGILASKGQSLGFNMDDMAIIPVTTGMKLFNQSSLFRILVQAADPTAVQPVLEQARAILKQRHDNEEDFTLITQDAMLKTFRNVIGSLTVALAGIAAISLAVAGIGIMNVMLVSVSERTTEVGLLKALGARRRQILGVFLAEALSLSVLGALLGVAIGLGLIAVAAGLWPAFPISPSLPWIGVVMFLSLAAGAGFGLMPARRAARLPAAEALRGRIG